MKEAAEQGPQRRGLKVVLIVFGILVTAALGSTAFVTWNFGGEEPLMDPRFSIGEFVTALGDHLVWLIVFALLSAAMLPLRALQWQFTLERKVRFSERWHFVNIGATVHNLIPGNLGDVMRAFLLARTQRFPFVVSLGSVAICKLLELATLIIMAGLVLLLPLWARIPQVVDALRIGTWILVGFVFLVLVLAHFSRPLAKKLELRGRLPRLQRILGEVTVGLGTARSFKGMFLALLASFPPNMAAALAYGIGLQAIGVRNGLLAGPLLLTLIALGKGVPGLPTGPGMYFLVTSWVARILGASAEDAAAFALLTNIATGVSQWVPGLVSLGIRRIRWSELKAQTSMAAEAARAAKSGELDKAERVRRGVRRDVPAES